MKKRQVVRGLVWLAAIAFMLVVVARAAFAQDVSAPRDAPAARSQDTSMASARDAPGARRFALIVGSNDGGPARTPLRYAQSDALAFASLLKSLGGTTPSDIVTLLEPSRAQFEAGVEALRTRMNDRGDSTRIELIVYFSGHSDEMGLLLGSDSLLYPEFRATLQALPADVRIAVVDSCQSGALTRRKGGTIRPPFLLDNSASVRGTAILTSSSETEAAQESDRVRGSFFTHFLLSGMRGAADVTHDRKVTLNEAYQFAFAETLARTEGTKYGAQHAAYEIELAGSGDVVMTDLRSTSASLVIDQAVSGRVFVRDSYGALIAELLKVAGRSVEIGLAPGNYNVRVDQADLKRALSGSLRVPDKTATRLSLAMLDVVLLEATARRGADEDFQDARHVPFAFSLWPGVPPWPRHDTLICEHLQLSIVYGMTDYLRGFALATGASRVTHSMHGLQLSFFGAVANGGGKGAQLAGFYSALDDRFSGVQLAGFWATAENLRGVQLSAMVAKAQDMKGVQVGGIASMSRNFTGAKLAAVSAVTTETLYGAQIAGIANVVEQDVHGLQLALVNVGGGDLYGAQIGLVNVAKVVHGTQIGLFNVAEDVHGVSLGLVSYIRNQRFGTEVSTSTGSHLDLAVRYDTHGLFYTYVTFGFRRFHRVGDSNGYAGLGAGAHLYENGRLSLDLDVMVADPSLGPKGGQHDIFLRHRFSVVYKMAPPMSVFAGLSWSQYMGWHGRDNEAFGTSFLATETHSGDFTLRTGPGIHVGFRI